MVSQLVLLFYNRDRNISIWRSATPHHTNTHTHFLQLRCFILFFFAGITRNKRIKIFIRQCIIVILIVSYYSRGTQIALNLRHKQANNDSFNVKNGLRFNWTSHMFTRILRHFFWLFISTLWLYVYEKNKYAHGIVRQTDNFETLFILSAIVICRPLPLCRRKKNADNGKKRKKYSFSCSTTDCNFNWSPHRRITWTHSIPLRCK